MTPGRWPAMGSAPQGHEQAGAAAEHEGQKRRQLQLERAAEGDHDAHAGGHADEQEEDGAQADGHRAAAVGVGQTGVDAERGDEDIHHGESAEDVEQVFEGDCVFPPQVEADRQRQQEHFFGDVEHAPEFSEDELGWREIGDQQQIEGAEVSFGGDGRDGQRS